MSTASQAEQFISLLTEAYQADQAIRNACLAQKHKERAAMFRNRQLSDSENSQPSSEQPDNARLTVNGRR